MINAHDIDLRVGQRIRRARRLAGLSQQQLAAELGVSYQQVHKYEWAANRISMGRLAQVAQATGRPITWFVPGPPGPESKVANGDDRLLLSVARMWPQLSVPTRRRVTDLVMTIVRESRDEQ